MVYVCTCCWFLGTHNKDMRYTEGMGRETLSILWEVLINETHAPQGQLGLLFVFPAKEFYIFLDLFSTFSKILEFTVYKTLKENTILGVGR